MNKQAKNAKFPHNMIIDIFSKDSTHADDAIPAYAEYLKKRNPDGWERYIQVLTYVYKHGLTLQETANKMSISRERARQILALNKRHMKSITVVLFPEEIPLEKSDSIKLDCHFSTRTINALYRYGVRTKDDILNIAPDALIRIIGIGKNAVEEIMRYIGNEYFEKWFSDISNTIDASKIDANSIYAICKNYEEDC